MALADRGRIGRALDGIAGNTSRRGFLARMGGAMTAATVGGVVGRAIEPGEAEAYHFCGHIFTTDSCPHPADLPRIDGQGYPLRQDGRKLDDIGRLVNEDGLPVSDKGDLLRDPDGRPLPAAPRTKVCVRTGQDYGFKTWIDGGWYRCCGGEVRKLVDCCSYSRNRINGDAALTGYCFNGRKVFCVMYFQTKVPC